MDAVTEAVWSERMRPIDADKIPWLQVSDDEDPIVTPFEIDNMPTLDVQSALEKQTPRVPYVYDDGSWDCPGCGWTYDMDTEPFEF